MIELSLQIRSQFQAFIEILLRFILVSEIHPRQSAIEIGPGDLWIAFDRASEVVDCFRHFSFFHPRGTTSLVGPCHVGRETNCAIKAWYKPGEGIFLDESLQPETNTFDRSILLHELVHYFQDSSGYYRDASPCDRWLQRELDAYDVQNRYLGAIGSPRRVAYAGNNCHAAGVTNDGILRRQVFSGKSRDIDTED